MNNDGSIERYKARLVAQGFDQKFGSDYDEIFLPCCMFGVIDSTFYSMWIGASSSGCGHGIPEQHVAKGNLYGVANRIRERRGGTT